MKLKGCILVSSIFAAAHAIVIESTDSIEQNVELHSVTNDTICPNYQLQCPDCPEGQLCVHPDSGGCEGAGIPVCQAVNCHGVVCLIKRLPCPDECPFSCRYNGPACCPFIGEPVCEPECQTFAPCHVTACPEDCPGDCFYPEADFCCPNAGKAVCNKDKWTLALSAIVDISPSITASHHLPTVHKNYASGYKSGGAPIFEGFNNVLFHTEERDAESPFADYYQNREPGNIYNPYYGYGYNGNYGGYGHGDHEDNNNYDHDHQKHREDNYNHGHDRHQHQHQHHDGDSGGCPVCTKTITDVSVDIEFATTTRSPGPIICAQYIIPCPDECPDTCIYPTHLPCPLTHKPWCPSNIESPEEESCEYLYNTEGYPIPYFPTTDPFYSIFSSILNNSGVTSTPSHVTSEPTIPPDIICPLIFVYCPPECPDTCLRKNVPCPFAEEGYCPNDQPSATITEVSTTNMPMLCPLYMLACPYCPQGFSCTRDMVGYCPNTNVPYCVSSPTFTEMQQSIFEVSPDLYAPEPTPWYDDGNYETGYRFDFRAMALPNAGDDSVSTTSVIEESIDACAQVGLTRVENSLVFDQLQEKRSDCQGCPILEFDENCDNTCVFYNEKSCCLQVRCLSDSKTVIHLS